MNLLIKIYVILKSYLNILKGSIPTIKFDIKVFLIEIKLDIN